MVGVGEGGGIEPRIMRIQVTHVTHTTKGTLIYRLVTEQFLNVYVSGNMRAS